MSGQQSSLSSGNVVIGFLLIGLVALVVLAVRRLSLLELFSCPLSALASALWVISVACVFGARPTPFDRILDSSQPFLSIGLLLGSIIVGWCAHRARHKR